MLKYNMFCAQSSAFWIQHIFFNNEYFDAKMNHTYLKPSEDIARWSSGVVVVISPEGEITRTIDLDGELRFSIFFEYFTISKFLLCFFVFRI